MIDRLKNYRPSGELVLGSIGGLLALIIALLFANFYIYRARGATPPVSITVSPSSGNFAVGASQEVNLFIQTASAQNYIEGFDVTLNATGQTQFVSLVNPTSPVEVVGIANPAAFTEVIKNVTPTSMRLSFVTLETDTSRLPTNLLVKFNINGTAEGAGGITINTGSSSVVGNNPSCSQGEPNCTTYSWGTITNGSYNFTTSTPSLWLVPSSANVNINDTFDVQVRLNTGNSQVSAVDSVLNYNTTYLAVTNVTPGSTFYRYVGIQDSADYVDEIAGKIKISGQIEASTNPTPVSGSDLLFATITFQALQPIAATDVSFDFLVNDSTESNIVEYSTSNDILASVGNGSYSIVGITPTATPIPPTSTPAPTNVPTPTNTPTPTSTPIPPTATPIPPTSTPTPTNTPIPTPTATPIPTVAPQAVALNLNLKLEGRDTKNLNNRDVTLTIEETGAITNTTVNNAGSALSVSLGQLLPGNYTLRVKPKGYLSKTANLTVAPGNSYTVDFGTNTFKAGDVSTIEDDLVNALDYSRLLTNFFLQGANIELFDFNGDATVNGVDFSYMLRNWTASQAP